jgi:hypothetical protein
MTKAEVFCALAVGAGGVLILLAALTLLDNLLN